MLLSAQISASNLLASHVLNSMPACERLEQAAVVLSQAQDQQPQATAILCHQAWMGRWIARCLDALKEPRTPQTEMNRLAAMIGGIAAVAALRAGIDAETWTLAENGRLVLPTLGSFLLASMESAPVRLVIRGGTLKTYAGKDVLELLEGKPAPDNWLAMRHLSASHGGHELDLIFDDLDPLRDCFGAKLTERVPDDRFGRWNELFSAGWRLLCTHSPRRAAELSAGMRVLVPVAEEAGRSEISVSSQDTLGALAMTLPTDRAHMAIALVHEQAHSTLNGLLHLVPLFDRTDRSVYFAPWRPDPRPIGGLLHGTFAFLTVADTWLRFSADASLRRIALQEFALRRVQWTWR